MNSADTELHAEADRVRCELAAQDDAWGTSGWTRRRFLAGAGMAGVAALGSQLVTTRAAYAASPSSTDRSLVVVFLRGAADGLRILVPNSPGLGLDYLQQVRPGLLPGATTLIPLPGTEGWALNQGLRPLYDGLWASGELGFVPGVSSTGITRSHFQAQQFLEHGGSDSASTGWLDRLLETLGPGSTFRAVSEGSATPVSMSGSARSITLSSLRDFDFPGWDAIRPQSQRAVLDLYRGLGGTLGEDVPTTIGALRTAADIRSVSPSAVTYPGGSFATALQDLAAILRAEVGLQVATVDVGGWDTHTNEAHDLDNNLAASATALRAFMDDLGPERRRRVTVVVMTEFGRRVEMNGSGGSDHGHGSLMWLLGGGLARSDVFGRWTPLAADSLDNGDVPGVNDPFDVLGELAQRRLGVGSLRSVFPYHRPRALGLAATG